MMGDDRLQQSLQALDGNSFENFVGEVWRARGWSVEVMPPGKDRGVDIIAKKSGIYDEKAVIQTKCYSEGNKVGRPEIQQYNTLREQESSVDTVIVVTSSEFTREAQQLANSLNVKLVNGQQLAEASTKHLSSERLSQFLPANPTNPSSTQTTTPGRTIAIDDLSESEEDLAKMYKEYFRRLGGLGQRAERRSLFFNIETDKEGVQEYSVVGTTHQVKFKADTPKPWKQLEKTADKYGWTILQSRTYGKGAGGIEMIKPPGEASVFFHAIQTSEGDSVSPLRQAKISSLLLDRIFGQSLSGMSVTDLPSDHTSESYERVIK